MAPATAFAAATLPGLVAFTNPLTGASASTSALAWNASAADVQVALNGPCSELRVERLAGHAREVVTNGVRDRVAERTRELFAVADDFKGLVTDVDAPAGNRGYVRVGIAPDREDERRVVARTCHGLQRLGDRVEDVVVERRLRDDYPRAV